MSTVATETVTVTPLGPPPGPRLRRVAWHWRHDPKFELLLAWWLMVVFYQIFGLVYFVLTRTQPPPNPAWDAPTVAQWFQDNHYGLLVGFGIMFLIAGMTAPQNALISYSMRRMSVSRSFAYSYLVLYSLSAFPGMVLMCIVLTVGAMRPDRDPELLRWLYEFGLLSYTGTMGVFLLGSLIFMVAVLIDRNRVFPKWFGYLMLCNALTEVVVSPAWIFDRGPFAWNGVIAWWVDMVVFVFCYAVLILMLRKLVRREDFGTGPLPELAQNAKLDPSGAAGAAGAASVAGAAR